MRFFFHANLGVVPACVVGVVGLGHINGIKNNWEKPIDLTEIMKEPAKVSKSARYLKTAVLVSTIAAVGLFVLRRR
jgi:pheromone shutdown protein TraB